MRRIKPRRGTARQMIRWHLLITLALVAPSRGCTLGRAPGATRAPARCASKMPRDRTRHGLRGTGLAFSADLRARSATDGSSGAKVPRLTQPRDRGLLAARTPSPRPRRDLIPPPETA